MCAFRNLSLALSHMLMSSNLMAALCKGTEYMDEQEDTGSGISTSLPTQLRFQNQGEKKNKTRRKEKRILRAINSSKRGLARTHPRVCLYMGENKCAAVIGP